MILEKKHITVCAIVGTNHRNSNTEYFVRRYVGELKKHLNIVIDFEIINLNNYHISNCIGCYSCAKTNCCIIKDDIELIKQKIRNSDMIIFATPIYMNNVTGIFKTFIDRLHIWTKVMFLTGKVAIILTTSSHKGGETWVHNYLSNILSNMGVLTIGKYNMTLDIPKELYSSIFEEKLIKLYVDSLIINMNKSCNEFITEIHEAVFDSLRSQIVDLVYNENIAFIWKYWHESGMIGVNSFSEYYQSI